MTNHQWQSVVYMQEPIFPGRELPSEMQKSKREITQISDVAHKIFQVYIFLIKLNFTFVKKIFC